MIRRIYWGLAILAIMIVGFVAFQLYRHIDLTNRLKNGPSIVTETPTTPDVVDAGPPIDVPEDDPIQPIEPHEEQTAEVPHEDSQQNNSPKLVAVKNHLEGLGEANFMDSITIPSDSELANYTVVEVRELDKQFFEVALKLHAINKEYVKRTLAVQEAQRTASGDNAKELLRQRQQLMLFGMKITEQKKRLKQEMKRLIQHK